MVACNDWLERHAETGAWLGVRQQQVLTESIMVAVLVQVQQPRDGDPHSGARLGRKERQWWPELYIRCAAAHAQADHCSGICELDTIGRPQLG
jgi:hypothetical protein